MNSKQETEIDYDKKIEEAILTKTKMGRISMLARVNRFAEGIKETCSNENYEILAPINVWVQGPGAEVKYRPMMECYLKRHKLIRFVVKQISADKSIKKLLKKLKQQKKKNKKNKKKLNKRKNQTEESEGEVWYFQWLEQFHEWGSEDGNKYFKDMYVDYRMTGLSEENYCGVFFKQFWRESDFDVGAYNYLGTLLSDNQRVFDRQWKVCKNFMRVVAKVSEWKLELDNDYMLKQTIRAALCENSKLEDALDICK